MPYLSFRHVPSHGPVYLFAMLCLAAIWTASLGLLAQLVLSLVLLMMVIWDCRRQKAIHISQMAGQWHVNQRAVYLLGSTTVYHRLIFLHCQEKQSRRRYTIALHCFLGKSPAWWADLKRALTLTTADEIQ